MRKLLAVLAFLVLAVSPSLAGDAVPGDLIIVIRKNTSARTLNTDAQAAAHSFAQSQNLSVTHTFDALSELGGYSFVTVHSDTEDENTLLQRLKSHPEVAAASLNRIITLDLPKVPDDTEYFRLWGMQAVNATQAWTLGTGSDDVYVAVVDTGIDYNHPDLRDNFSHEYSRNFVGVNRAGYDPSAYIDRHSHGTHVAGTIAGVGNNALGVAGVNWRAKVFSVRVLNDNGFGTTEEIIAGLDYIAGLLSRHPALKLAALNFSVGDIGSQTPEEIAAYNDPMYLAFKILGDTDRLVMCMAAGNETLEAGAPAPSTVYNSSGNLRWEKGSYTYAASFMGLSNNIVTAAATRTLTPASFTNYSRKFVDMAAPGQSIYSTILVSQSDDTGYASVTNPYPYGQKSGTSMAAPHVTGTAALLKSLYPDASASQIRAAIIGGANGDYLRDDGTSAYGLLDVAGAIDFMARIMSDDAVPAVHDAEIPAGVVGQRYRFEFCASGTFPMTWTADGTLPSGLTFSDGKISGTPTESGSFPLTVTAANKNGSSSLVVSLRIDDAEAPVIDGAKTSYDAYVSMKYTADAVTSAGSWPIFWSLDGGEVPGDFGLVVDEAAGRMTFTPTKAGTFTFSLTASNDAGTDTKPFTLRVHEAKAPVIMDTELADGVPGRVYGAEYSNFDTTPSTTITAEGTRPVSWDVSGLPEGLTFTVNDRADILTESRIEISGRPESAGVFTLTVTASNDFGIMSRDFTLTISDDAPSFVPQASSVMYRGLAFSRYFPVKGSSPITFTKSGNIPDGTHMKYEDNTAILYGTPSRAGTYTFTLTAENVKGTDTLSMTVDVIEPLAITTYYLPDAVKGRQYTASITSLNGSPAMWKISADESLGLEISQAGVVTGLPAEAGKFTVCITISSDSDFDAGSYSLTVLEIPAITTKILADGKINAPYPETVLSADGTAPVAWSVSEGRMPAGLTLSANGHLYGTPTESGTFTFTVRAENKAGYDVKKLTLKAASSGSSQESPDVPPEPESAPKSDDVKPVVPEVIIRQGSARDISSLTIGELAAINNADGIIAAILPEMSVNYPGFYTFESIDAFSDVKISDDVPSGWFLVWNAFTRGGANRALMIENAEDDNVQFTDSDGKITITVPENHILNVSAWLDADTVYAPVISAVKEGSNEAEGVGAGSGGCAAMTWGISVIACAVMFMASSHKEDK